MEIKGEIGDILIMDDYGHHPTEIQKTLVAIKQFYPKRRLVVVYQPHQYSRTKLLFSDFATSFSLADQLILADIYAVPGRDEKREVESSDLAEAVVHKGKPKEGAFYLGSYEKIQQYLKDNVKKDDLILTMGATKIYEVGEWLINHLSKL